jgi:hypothetical protein
MVVCALTVSVTDAAFQSSLLRAFWPLVIEPPDGALLSAPVTVHWQGQQSMLATLRGAGFEHELGLRSNPFEIPASEFPHPGRYEIEVRSPTFGHWISAERRFRIRHPTHPKPPPRVEKSEAPRVEEDTTAKRLQEEAERLTADKEALNQKIDDLEHENQDLADENDDLRSSGEESNQRVATLQAQQEALLQEHLTVMQENQLLRLQLQGIPPCTTWGYLTYPRPQTIPPTRRVVVVSNSRGQVFRSPDECSAARQRDPTAISACTCVGAVVSAFASP